MPSLLEYCKCKHIERMLHHSMSQNDDKIPEKGMPTQKAIVLQHFLFLVVLLCVKNMKYIISTCSFV